MPESRRRAPARRTTDPQPERGATRPAAAAVGGADPLPLPVPVAVLPATLRYQQRQQAILDAAARRFNAKGLRGATPADIARDVGLVTTSITC